MSVLRIVADVLIGLAVVLAAMSVGALIGAFVFLLIGWSILLGVGDEFGGRAVFLAFVGLGAFFGIAAVAAMWRSSELLDEQGPF